nr:hypothetical protein BgiMline_024099 [Biomphalaria glabrata]
MERRENWRFNFIPENKENETAILSPQHRSGANSIGPRSHFLPPSVTSDLCFFESVLRECRNNCYATDSFTAGLIYCTGHEDMAVYRPSMKT